ncbi:MAG: hypothetical protein ACOYUB_02385 [Patescibacteria group bacterium]
MTLARGVLAKKLFPIAILVLISAFIVSSFPPTNLAIILLLIAFLSMAAGLTAKLFFSHKIAVTTTVLAFVAMTIKALDLIDPMNIALAISLVVGISILIK